MKQIIYTEITKLHQIISNIRTPKSYIENDRPDGSGNDYIATNWMRFLLKKYFPVTNWTIESKGEYNKEHELIAWVTIGTLVWDYGYIGYPEIKCKGSMAASHQVQYIKNTSRLLDLGNDIKASNTDTWKKALNFHLNIGDDIYRWEHPELTEKQKKGVVELATEINDQYSKIVLAHIKIGDNEINKENYKKIIDSLKVKKKVITSTLN